MQRSARHSRRHHTTRNPMVPAPRPSTDEITDEEIIAMAAWYEEQQWGAIVCASDALDRSFQS